MSEHVTLDDIIKAYKCMTEHDLSQEEIKKAEEKIRKALKDIVNTPEKAKLLFETLGLEVI